MQSVAIGFPLKLRFRGAQKVKAEEKKKKTKYVGIKYLYKMHETIKSIQ